MLKNEFRLLVSNSLTIPIFIIFISFSLFNYLCHLFYIGKTRFLFLNSPHLASKGEYDIL
jgi:hypothetical protein